MLFPPFSIVAPSLVPNIFFLSNHQYSHAVGCLLYRGYAVEEKVVEYFSLIGTGSIHSGSGYLLVITAVFIPHVPSGWLAIFS